jgi:uncharacterized membrane protein YuzA (DUF378 family)
MRLPLRSAGFWDLNLTPFQIISPDDLISGKRDLLIFVVNNRGQALRQSHSEQDPIMTHLLRYLLIAGLFISSGVRGQSFLRISLPKLNSVKTYEVFTGEILVYKTRGHVFYESGKILAMYDSTIVLDQDRLIHLRDLKAIRLDKQVHLIKTLTTVFYRGSVGFFSLNTLNNLIINSSPVVSENAAYVSVGLAGVGLLIRETGLKRIRINRNKGLKILHMDFQNLNGQKEGGR